MKFGFFFNVHFLKKLHPDCILLIILDDITAMLSEKKGRGDMRNNSVSLQKEREIQYRLQWCIFCP